MAGIDSSRFQKKKASSTVSYSDARYWNVRYTEKGPDPKQDLSFATFDWYLRFEQLKEALLPLLPDKGAPPTANEAEADAEPSQDQRPRFLVLGCGTSTLSEDLYNEGYVHITNVDRCEGLIEHLAAKHQDKSETVRYEALDATKGLPQEWTGQFDVVIDKACLDMIASGKDARQEVPAVLNAVSRVLKPRAGVYICISHAAPELRQPMLSGTNDLKAVVSKKMRWRVSCYPLSRLLVPPPDPQAKGGGAAKGGAVELKPSATFQAEDFVYNMYACQRPPELVDDAIGWFDFWASPAMVLTRDDLARSLIKSFYVPEADRPQLRATVARVWARCAGDAESVRSAEFVAEDGMANMLIASLVDPSQASEA